MVSALVILERHKVFEVLADRGRSAVADDQPRVLGIVVGLVGVGSVRRLVAVEVKAVGDTLAHHRMTFGPSLVDARYHWGHYYVQVN